MFGEEKRAGMLLTLAVPNIKAFVEGELLLKEEEERARELMRCLSNL